MTTIQKLDVPFRIYTILFALISIFSLYLVWHHYALINGNYGFGSFCSINQTLDCDVVNTSRYSTFLNIPIATWSLAYGIIGLLVSAMACRNAYSKMFGVNFLFVFSAVGVLTSVVMLSLSLFALQKLCLLCSLLQVLNLVTFFIIFFTARSFLNISNLWNVYSKKLFSFFISGLGVLLLAHVLTSQWKMEFEFNEESFVQDLQLTKTVNIPVTPDSPRVGTSEDKAKLVLVEFFDYQCPACGFAARQMHRLAKAYGDQILIIYKNYPLDPACNPNTPNARHLQSCLAARAAHCAHLQGKFDWMHEKLFSNQHEINEDNIKAWSHEGHLDEAAFQACLDDKQTKQRILEDIQAATEAGLDSTPTFFVNGKKVVGPITERKLEILLQELGKK